MIKTLTLLLTFALLVRSRTIEDSEEGLGSGLVIANTEDDIELGSLRDSEDIGHNIFHDDLKSEEEEMIGHSLGGLMKKRSAESLKEGILADEEEDEEVGHGIKSNHAWRK